VNCFLYKHNLTTRSLACLVTFLDPFCRSTSTPGAICLPLVHGGAPQAACCGAQVVERHSVQAEELHRQPDHKLREFFDLQRGAQSDRQSQGEAREYAGKRMCPFKSLFLLWGA